MLNKDKIVLMTKACLYEKYLYPKDRDEVNYFKYDYIMKNNMLNVLFVTFITAIWIVLFRFTDILTNELFFELDLLVEVFKQSIWIIILVDIAFFIIGLFVYGKKYDTSEIRMEEYYSTLEKINEMERE